MTESSSLTTNYSAAFFVVLWAFSWNLTECSMFIFCFIGLALNRSFEEYHARLTYSALYRSF